jgi:hypothetical protein
VNSDRVVQDLQATETDIHKFVSLSTKTLQP